VIEVRAEKPGDSAAFREVQPSRRFAGAAPSHGVRIRLTIAEEFPALNPCLPALRTAKEG